MRFCSLLPGVAGAIEEDLARKGWFLGGGFNYNIHLFEDDVEDSFGGLGSVDEAWGVNARFGYRFNKWVAAELQFEWVEGFDTKVLGIDVFSIEAFTWTVNGKFYYPIEQFHPYLLLGVGTTLYKLKDQTGLGESFDADTDLSGRFGLGCDFYLFQNWLVYLEGSVVLTTNDLGNITGQSSLSGI